MGCELSGVSRGSACGGEGTAFSTGRGGTAELWAFWDIPGSQPRLRGAAAGSALLPPARSGSSPPEPQSRTPVAVSLTGRRAAAAAAGAADSAMHLHCAGGLRLNSHPRSGPGGAAGSFHKERHIKPPAFSWAAAASVASTAIRRLRQHRRPPRRASAAPGNLPSQDEGRGTLSAGRAPVIGPLLSAPAC